MMSSPGDKSSTPGDRFAGTGGGGECASVKAPASGSSGAVMYPLLLPSSLGGTVSSSAALPECGPIPRTKMLFGALVLIDSCFVVFPGDRSASGSSLEDWKRPSSDDIWIVSRSDRGAFSFLRTLLQPLGRWLDVSCWISRKERGAAAVLCAVSFFIIRNVRPDKAPVPSIVCPGDSMTAEATERQTKARERK